ncbi:MAG TPA: hypothetical protein PK605_13615 [Ignavibacteria bacterium]|nr:hypothetical protein [Bacteroidota bacterium]HRE10985.1 hypothetical protein [Ignavibacteria bacterium]HRF65194.1 hypothetical protein [Ignavibacteria bacterium]HRJ05434.1 hypothetical protein [Ignavibacteria bacterium]
MDIREEVLKEHSKKQVLKIAAWIGNDENRYRQFLYIFLNDEYRVVQRVSWVLSEIAENHPKLVEKNIGKIVNKLDEKDIHVAVKRNVIRVLQFLNIPVRYRAKIFDHSIKYIADPNEKIAVRCFAMTVAAKIAAQYPELLSELEQTINLLKKDSTPGLKARAKMVLKEIAKHKFNSQK